ncbi:MULTISPECIES: hypothetical protein [unclassified Streptomyces]|uniref:hypothetical protein n=1 Tax=unclassified Streptomyces TaxID=2593676 RepID=UPI00224FE36A|nr:MULTISPECIES: hypothetical protein [unclassified Streptomyces]MCX4409744.1 hypothetical protein [Streptomyces sp. NBC_01764]MCX5191519.1 hypothetical protein [Streptomyces sp. NBC_00268]
MASQRRAVLSLTVLLLAGGVAAGEPSAAAPAPMPRAATMSPATWAALRAGVWW